MKRKMIYRSLAIAALVTLFTTSITWAQTEECPIEKYKTDDDHNPVASFCEDLTDDKLYVVGIGEGRRMSMARNDAYMNAMQEMNKLVNRAGGRINKEIFENYLIDEDGNESEASASYQSMSAELTGVLRENQSCTTLSQWESICYLLLSITKENFDEAMIANMEFGPSYYERFKATEEFEELMKQFNSFEEQ